MSDNYRAAMIAEGHGASCDVVEMGGLGYGTRCTCAKARSDVSVAGLQRSVDTMSARIKALRDSNLRQHAALSEILHTDDSATIETAREIAYDALRREDGP